MMKQTILIVEDEPAIADNICFALETEGFSTLWLALGADVLSLLSNQTIDLIILDAGLPDVNGFELCKAIFNDVYRKDFSARIYGLAKTTMDLRAYVTVGRLCQCRPIG